MWQELFPEHILQRGFLYYSGEHIHDVFMKDGDIELFVHGSEIYHVRIKITDQEIKDLHCSCPYANEMRYCKHIAAALFYLDEHGTENLELTGVETVEDLVETVDPLQLKRFLIRLLKDDERLYHGFKQEFQTKLTALDMSYYKKLVDYAIASNKSYYDSFSPDDIYSLVYDMKRIINNEINSLLKHKHLQEAFELSTYIFMQVGDEDAHDEDGEISAIGYQLYDIWKEMYQLASLDFKRTMFSWFMEESHYYSENYVESFIKDFIFECFQEAEFLEEKIVYLDEEILFAREYLEQHTWVSRSTLSIPMLKKIDVLQKLQVSDKEIEEYCLENLDVPEMKECLAKQHIKKKELDTAIHLLEELRDDPESSQSRALKYRLQLKELYKETGQKELYTNELWSLLRDHKHDITAIFQELKLLYDADEWLVKREHIFTLFQYPTDVGKLLAIEALHARLLDLVLSTEGFYILESFESTLNALYPDEILGKYEKEIERMAKPVTNRESYQLIALKLIHMKSIPGGDLVVNRIVDRWKQIYKNRRAMMDEIKKV